MAASMITGVGISDVYRLSIDPVGHGAMQSMQELHLSA
jgi:hypothetical protein